MLLPGHAPPTDHRPGPPTVPAHDLSRTRLATAPALTGALTLGTPALAVAAPARSRSRLLVG
ncbi:hypothetical protein OG535_23065 [Kitasatospora sp. NBC_00085]|uniref:hypothetical protein n=1 Tax=unclassified Kitasatospora TaxID=2633591 RepID=UPI00324C8101